MKTKISVTLLIAILISLAAWTKYWYNAGQDKILNSNLIADLHNQIEELKVDISSQEATTITVVEYKDKIIEVEKQVPIYVNTIKEIFAYDDGIIIPSELARLHDKIVCDSREIPKSTCRVDDSAPRTVTLGEFSTTVADNYIRCSKNTKQLSSLIDWVDWQDRIINH